MSGVVLPVDRLPALWPERLRGRRTGALLHAASVTSQLRPTLSVLEEMDAHGQIRLAALFGPQHGFETTTQDNMIEWTGYRHPRLGIPVHSLYGEHREPTDEMLEGLEVLFIDLVDVGARYYTFIWTMLLCLKAAARRGMTVVVADRPNPINGVDVEGRPQREDHLSFVGLHPLPVRHGKTIGELAKMFRDELFPGTDLVVLPLENWNRTHYIDE
ncbi:MAG: exo-beta-N-acetylmuramidase NamZ domain-containing protein, partial [Chthoniobacterales bacterium]